MVNYSTAGNCRCCPLYAASVFAGNDAADDAGDFTCPAVHADIAEYYFSLQL